MSAITISRLTKTYNPKEIPVNAVNEVDLSFQMGEFTAIVGPSGSGKTTLLNMLGGIDTPTNGTVTIGSNRISDLKGNKLTNFRMKNIGFVFQNYNLLPVLTAKENVAFVMELQKISKKKRDARAKELLCAVGLADKINVRPNKLSGGQQQRVAVARALASKPSVILADEPTANLDSKTAAELLDLMEDLNKKEGVTFIFSTHDQHVIDKARRVIRFEDGKVVEDR